MLRILGSPKKLCSGMSRREMLVAGGLGFFGLSLRDYFQLSQLQAGQPSRHGSGFGRAKSCILLYLYGAPSQLELCDMKPAAPVEIRGELKPISSSLPGLDVCELMPNAAKVMHLTTVVRSMTHPYPIHGVAYALTGVPQIDIPMELNPRDSRHWPFIGSVVDHVTRSERPSSEVPDNIALPFPFSSQRVGEVPRAGPYAAYLGSAYQPLWTTFHGRATGYMEKTLAEQKVNVAEPYIGITPESRFELAGATDLPPEISVDRLHRRRSLLEQFEHERRSVERKQDDLPRDRYREMAYRLIGSDKARQALDIHREPPAVRDMYGMTLFGQSCLAARRLVEAGSRFVSVFWDEFGLAGSAWDTHWNHYPRLKQELMPGFDRAFYGLIRDLDERGLLDETLVLCLSEHGRTPKLDNRPGGGRDHWSQAYTCLFAGGGVARGKVVGKTDRHGGAVVDRPVSPKDILATTYHLLGIDPHFMLTDRIGRPVPLLPDGSVVTEMLA